MTKRIPNYPPYLMKQLLQWAALHWGREWIAGSYVCTSPWVDMVTRLYGWVPELQPTGNDSLQWADAWYRVSTQNPIGRDPLLFQFQIEDDMIDAQHPNGVTHIELVLEMDPVTRKGILMGVGIAAGPAPLNNYFCIHRTEPGLSGDGFFDEGPTKHLARRWIDIEALIRRR